MTLREPIMRGTQKKPDLIEGITLAPAVTGRVLLNAATHLTWGVASELDDMKGIEHAGGVLELVIDGVLAVPGRGPVSRSGYRSGSLRRALLASSHARCQTFPGPGPLKRGVGCSFPRVVHDAGELTWVLVGVGPGDAIRTYQPPAPARLRSGRGHQMRLADTA